MSDGPSEIARDKERGEYLDNFHESLADYLENPSDKKLENLKGIAEETDSVRGGYWSGKTHLLKNLEKKLRELGEGNKTSWARLLRATYETRYASNVYQRLKNISPYADKVLLFVSYGSRSSNIDSTMELSDLVDKKVRDSEMKTFGADDYFLVFDKKEFERLLKNASVEWVS